MSYKDKEGQAQLCIVDLAHPSVHVDLSHWQAVGMQGTQTAQVHFDNTPVILSDCQIAIWSVGFWHGAAGVAACWYGAAVRLVSFLHKSCTLNPNAFKKCI